MEAHISLRNEHILQDYKSTSSSVLITRLGLKIKNMFKKEEEEIKDVEYLEQKKIFWCRIKKVSFLRLIKYRTVGCCADGVYMHQFSISWNRDQSLVWFAPLNCFNQAKRDSVIDRNVLHLTVAHQTVLKLKYL